MGKSRRIDRNLILEKSNFIEICVVAVSSLNSSLKSKIIKLVSPIKLIRLMSLWLQGDESTRIRLNTAAWIGIN